jgi:prepilin-type N-terminal cleavage/methylation domain-containing protein
MRPILEKESERYGRGDNSMKPLYQRHYRASGFTLIEIMIVVALMALILGVGIFGLGIIGRADVNGEALRFSSAVRYTFNMAATSNKTLQLKIDFENRRFSVDELELSGGLSDDVLRGTTLSNKDDENHWRNEERAMKLDGEDTRFGALKRTQVDEMFLSGDDANLKEGVYFIGLMTSHHDEVQTDGIGTINFFANGFVERSVIFLGDEKAYHQLGEDVPSDSEDAGIIYTISISPLTGNSSVRPGRIEVSSTFFEEEED